MLAALICAGAIDSFLAFLIAVGISVGVVTFVKGYYVVLRIVEFI
jgi:hypothetical protein